jgi:hypothetical protein
MGGLKDWSGDFAVGLLALAGAAALSAALVMMAGAAAKDTKGSEEIRR